MKNGGDSYYFSYCCMVLFYLKGIIKNYLPFLVVLRPISWQKFVEIFGNAQIVKHSLQSSTKQFFLYCEEGVIYSVANVVFL